MEFPKSIMPWEHLPSFACARQSQRRGAGGLRQQQQLAHIGPGKNSSTLFGSLGVGLLAGLCARYFSGEFTTSLNGIPCCLNSKLPLLKSFTKP